MVARGVRLPTGLFRTTDEGYRSLLIAVTVVQAVLFFSHGSWNYWDGGVIDYGIGENDLSGLKKWFFDSNWHIEYWFLWLEAEAAKLTHIHFRYFEYTILVGCLIASSAAVYRLYRSFFGELSGAWCAALFMAASPVWSLGLSSVMVPQIAFLTLGLVGATTVLLARSTPARLAGAATLIVSFQLNPVATMTLGIAMIALALRKELRREALALATISLAGCVVIVLIQRLSPPVGVAANYNLLIPTDPDDPRYPPGYWSAFSRLRSAGQALAAFATPLVWISFVQVIATRRVREGSTIPTGLAVCVSAALVAVLPYIVLGRVPGFLDFRGWQLRHALVVFPFLALAATQATRSWSGRRRMILSLLVLAPVLSLTTARYVFFARRGADERMLVHSLAVRRPTESGTIVPDLHTRSNHPYGPHELSWLGYRAWGTSAFYPCVNRVFEECVKDTRTLAYTSEDRALRMGYVTDKFTQRSR